MSATTPSQSTSGNALATFLQTELMTLSAEAKRKHPEIKDAAERLLYILRSLKDRPTTAIPDGSDPVGQELSRTDDALRPFLMACETKNPKLVPIAVSCLQRLIAHQAIPEASIMGVLKTLGDLVGSSVELQLKVLQTVLPLLTNYRGVHGQVLAEALYLCFRLQETKSPIVNNTAAATVRQLVTFVFDKLAAEDEVNSRNREIGETGTTTPTVSNSLTTKDACMLFKDLCLLTSGEPAAFLPLQTLSKCFGLELIEAVISHHHALFITHTELCSLLRERVCPLIIKSFSDRLDFPLTCRLMRVVHIMLKTYSNVLVMECEIFLSMFCRLLDPDHAPLWHRVLIMEVFKSLCADATLLRFVYTSYDEKEHTTKVFHEMIAAFRRIVVAEKPALLLHPPFIASSDALDQEQEAQHSLMTNGSQIKLQCLDQLDKNDPPAIPETYIIYLAILCVNSIVESEAMFALPLLAEASTPSERKNDILLAIEMANASWGGILAALSFLVSASIDDDIFTMVIRAYQSITSVVGLLGLTSHRDAFLASLTKSCIPCGGAGEFSSKGDVGQGLHPASLQTLSRNHQQVVVVTERNVLCLRALINVAHQLTPILEDKAWYVILETLQVADKYITAGKTGRREPSSLALLGEVGGPKDSRLRSGSVASPSVGGLLAMGAGSGATGQHPSQVMENQYVTLLLVAKRLFESTTQMDEKNLLEFLKALCRLGRVSASTGAAGTPASGGVGGSSHVSTSSGTSTSAPKDASPMGKSSTDERSFAVTKLHDVILVNVSRMVQTSGAPLWDLVVSELIDLAHHPNIGPAVRAQVCGTLSEVLVAALQAVEWSKEGEAEAEMRVLEPLKKFMVSEVTDPTSTGNGRDLTTGEGGSGGTTSFQTAAVDGASLASTIAVIQPPPSTLEEIETRERILKSPWFVEVQKSGLETVNKILQNSGQHLSRGWPLIVEVIKTIVSARLRKGVETVAPSAGGANIASPLSGGADGQSVATAGSSAPSAVTYTNNTTTTPTPPAASKSGAVLVRVAFPCIQLICTDFLSLLSPPVLHQLIETLGGFGAQTDDLNIGLTAVGLLWSVSDYVVMKRMDLEKERTELPADSDSAAAARTTGTDVQLDESRSSKHQQLLSLTDYHLKRSVSSCIAALQAPISTRTMDALWMLLLGHLSQLCSDPRPEVRNSANQTLFRTISMNGGKLTLDAWEECIWGVLFPLLERVQGASAGTTAAAAAAGVTPDTPNMLHHSRNTFSKQWDETKVLTLTGISKCLLDFLPVLVNFGDGFDQSWGLFLQYCKNWCLSGSTEVAVAAIKCLKGVVGWKKVVAGGESRVDRQEDEESVAPTEIREGAHISENVSLRMSELMKRAWDVWEDIGRGIIAGADEHQGTTRTLEQLDQFTEPDNNTYPLRVVIPLQVLHGSVTQETLMAYVSVFSELHSQLRSNFTTAHLKSLYTILGQVLLYNTNPPPGATLTRMRVDFVNDVDNLTGLQNAILDIIVGGVSQGVEGGGEMTLGTLAAFVTFPFVNWRRSALGEDEPAGRSSVGGNATAISPEAYSSTASAAAAASSAASRGYNFTYMALAKKAVYHVVDVFALHKHLLTVYAHGPFCDVVRAVGLPMRARYACPPPGSKDTTPLWKMAATSMITIVKGGLDSLAGSASDQQGLVKALPKSVTDDIFYSLLDALDGLLLPTTPPPLTHSREELAADESFDLSILMALEEDVIPHVGCSWVSDGVASRLVDMIARGGCMWRSMCDGARFTYANAPSISPGTETSAQSGLVVDTMCGGVGGGDDLGTPAQSAPLTQQQPQHQSRSKQGEDLLVSSSVIVNPSTSQTATSRNRFQYSSSTDPASHLLGSDVLATPRETFAIACIDLLFRLCAADTVGPRVPIAEEPSHPPFRIAQIAAPILLSHCQFVMSQYVRDKPLYGSMPFPRIRNLEIGLILLRLRTTVLRPRILAKYFKVGIESPSKGLPSIQQTTMAEEDELRMGRDYVREWILSGGAALLFGLYPALCNVLSVVVGTSAIRQGYGGGGIGDDLDGDGDPPAGIFGGATNSTTPTRRRSSSSSSPAAGTTSPRASTNEPTPDAKGALPSPPSPSSSLAQQTQSQAHPAADLEFQSTSEAAVLKAVRNCLRHIGREMGLEA
ncbi:hypothetical protein DFS34DRAFT_242399 [Phlyctochytrium arcticum]|nr:hypothetical protein DFS34DRAFT_242399 [Phlyctochytrium arcticum]